jgi:hypothetical protein
LYLGCVYHKSCFSQRTIMTGNSHIRWRLDVLLSAWIFMSSGCSAFADPPKSDSKIHDSALQELERKADSDLVQRHVECIDEYRDCLSMIPGNDDISHRILLLKKLAEALALDGQSQQEVAIDVVTNIRPCTKEDLRELYDLLRNCPALNIDRLALSCDQPSLEKLRISIYTLIDSPLSQAESSKGANTNTTATNITAITNADISPDISSLKNKCLQLLQTNSASKQEQANVTQSSTVSNGNIAVSKKSAHREIIFSEKTLKSKGAADPGSNDFQGIEFNKEKIALSERTFMPSAWRVGPEAFDRILKERINCAFDSAKITDTPLLQRIFLLNEFADRALAACRFDVARLAIKDANRLFEDEQESSRPLYLELLQKNILIELNEGKFDAAKELLEEWQHLLGSVNSEQADTLPMIALSWQGSELPAKNNLQEKYKYWRREDAISPLTELTLVELAELYNKFKRSSKAQDILTEICQRRLENNRAPNLRACGLLAWTFETIGNSALAASTIAQALSDAESQDYSVADTETAWVDYYAGMIAQKESNGVRARRYYDQANRLLSKLSCSNGPLATRIKKQLVALK